VALARALVNHPRVLLLDEPLGALDLKLRKEMQIELKRIQQEVGITFIHVTHDQEEAMTMADAIAVMHAGKMERMGTPTEIYEDPRTAFVAGFLGASNLMGGKLEGVRVSLAGGATIHLTGERSAARVGPIQIGVRPEKIKLHPVGDETAPVNRLTGKVTDASFIGVSTHYLIDSPEVGELSVVVQNLDDRRFALGEAVMAAWQPEHTFVVEG
jgi:spermidine/putrescine transport system ATP-binding protein